MNTLYFGDNLAILREYIADESVDLIYLDPPFNSNVNYNILFAEHSGTKSAAQITAFEDTWEWNLESQATYRDIVFGAGKLSDLIQAFHAFLGTSDMMAYLVMMAIRLKELHRVLKPTGSIYLHCDPTASHYLKLVMDAIFGPLHFRNEIIWKRTTAHSDSKRWSAVADVLLYYTKGDSFTWNPQHGPHDEQYVLDKYTHDDGDGRLYRLDNMTSPNPRPNMMYEWKGHSFPAKGWRYSKETMAKLDAEGRIWYPASKAQRPQLKRYLDEMPGTILASVWTDISPINSQAKERLKYPTQKPQELLERVILASSNEGDVVLDPFFGCGTAVAAAEGLKRQWIGIDITHLAIALIRSRLEDQFKADLSPYQVIGVPKDEESARALWTAEPHQFEWWAISEIKAQPANDKKKGADAGIDGLIYFFDDASGKAKKIVVQVKGGHVQRKDIATLNSDRLREHAELAVLLTLEAPTTPMKTEAAEVGFYESATFKERRFPRIQILTIKQLFDGHRPLYPQIAPDATFKTAPRQKKEAEKQRRLL